MCDLCRFGGLERDCWRCGGFFWIDDVSIWDEDHEQFEQQLCTWCRRAWRRLMEGREDVYS